MADERKIFCGSGRIVNAWKRGVSICLEDIPEKFKKISDKNGKTYVNLEVIDLKEPNKWGKTVSVEVNQWTPGQANQQTKTSPNYKPSKPTQQANQRKQERENTPENFLDDSSEIIPF